jgi:cellular nucleic acid-binding protein
VARLLNPNRPRLIEPPQTIPLNDEFLQAFGRRVQQDDARLGRPGEAVDTSILEEEEHDKGSPSPQVKIPPSSQQQRSESNKTPTAAPGRKVKIWNLRYTTTERTLREACERFGDVEEVSVVMEDDNPSLNKGRAYVTFTDPEAAQSCLGQLTALDGRPLRTSLANSDLSGPGSTRAKCGGGGGATQARYWLVDLATKCYRCGKVGHLERECPNEAAPKPCPLCAKADHELRDCPVRSTCFNCGQVGHVSRDCPVPRGGRVVARTVCTLCGQSGHHRRYCRLPDSELFQRQRTDAISAICMVCRRPGHYCCKDSKWFYGLDTLTCWNCGRVGHDGTMCDRPRLEVCMRLPENAQVVKHEIERAGTYGTAEEHFAERVLLEQQQRQRQCDSSRGRQTADDTRRFGASGFQDGARRAKSLPPQRYNNYYGGRGSEINGSGEPGQQQQRDNGNGYLQQQRGGGGGDHYYDQYRPANRARYADDTRHRSNGGAGRRSKRPTESSQQSKRPRWR